MYDNDHGITKHPVTAIVRFIDGPRAGGSMLVPAPPPMSLDVPGPRSLACGLFWADGPNGPTTYGRYTLRGVGRVSGMFVGWYAFTGWV